MTRLVSIELNLRQFVSVLLHQNCFRKKKRYTKQRKKMRRFILLYNTISQRRK